MFSEILLGLREEPEYKLTVIKLSDINLKEKKVEELRRDTAGKTNLSDDAFDLIYCGSVLEDQATLESCGLKNGSMVHVLRRVKQKSKVWDSATDVNIQMLINMCKSFSGNPFLELALRRLTKRAEVIENVISTCPELNDDPVAVALLSDPDLITYFTDPETIKKIGKTHPALLEAVYHIASAVPEEAHNYAKSSLNSGAGPSSANSSFNSSSNALFNLENMSDDEEMAGADSSQSSDSANSNNRSRTNQPSQPQFTSGQIFAALSRAARRTSGSNNTGSSSSASLSRSNSNSGGVITFEMFDQAMQQAFASSTPTTNNSSTQDLTSGNIGAVANSINLQNQIAIMHEMGLINDPLNIQALQITNGDVQAAIELVLSGFGEN